MLIFVKKYLKQHLGMLAADVKMEIPVLVRSLKSLAQPFPSWMYSGEW